MITKTILISTITLTAALIGMTLYGCGRQVDYRQAAMLDEAQKAFDAAKNPTDYLKVADRYQQILDSGVHSWAIFYNQGNAMMKGHERGRAIAAYRQAQRLRPSDPYLKSNLQYALGPNVPAVPRRTIIGHLLFWQNWIGYPAKLQLALITAIITFVLGLIATLFCQKLVGRIAVVCVVITLILTFSAAYDWYRFDRIEHGVVVADDTIAKKGNAESYDPAFTEPLSDGTEFTLLSRRGDWLLIRMPGDKEGWILNKNAVVY